MEKKRYESIEFSVLKNVGIWSQAKALTIVDL